MHLPGTPSLQLQVHGPVLPGPKPHKTLCLRFRVWGLGFRYLGFLKHFFCPSGNSRAKFSLAEWSSELRILDLMSRVGLIFVAAASLASTLRTVPSVSCLVPRPLAPYVSPVAAASVGLLKTSSLESTASQMEGP